MTKLLEKAFHRVSALPARDQDAVADWLLQELESEQRWAKLFASSQEALSKLAAEALEEHRKGTTKSLRHGR